MNTTAALAFACSCLAAAAAYATQQPLSRSAAQAKIDANSEFRSTDSLPAPDDAAISRGIKDNIWQQGPQGWQPTSSGQRYFKSVSILAIKLQQPLHRKISSVTGIADAADPSEKTVEFTWHFTDLTEPIAIYTAATTGDHKGTAELRHYDDGWRVVNVAIGSYKDGTNTRPFPLPELTPAQALQIAVDQVCSMSTSWLGYSFNRDTYCINGKCDGQITFDEFFAGLTTNGATGKYLWRFDPWGHPYRFFVSQHGKSFEVRSLGSAGKLNLSVTGAVTDASANIARSETWVVRPASAKVGRDAAGYHNACDN